MPSAEEPQWLDADENATWLALTAMVLTLPGALEAQLQADSGMSFYEYMVLAMLSHEPDGTLRMRELAALTNGSLSRLSQVAARLERRGWLTRRPDPTDGRTTLASLTEEGRSALRTAAPGHVRNVRRLVFDPLTETQVRQLRTISDRIHDAVEPSGRDPFHRHPR